MCFFFRFPSVKEGLYVTVLFNEVGRVFETVLSWWKGAGPIPPLRFGRGHKRRGLWGRSIPSACYRIFIFHLWYNSEGKHMRNETNFLLVTDVFKSIFVSWLSTMSKLTSEYEGFSNVVLGFNFRLNKLHFDSYNQREKMKQSHTGLM